MEADFASFIVPIARAFWGDPNPSLSSKDELRWGNGGGRSVDVKKGAWVDWTNGTNGSPDGGGTLALVMREKNCDKAAALAWLEDEGFIEKRGREDVPRQPTSAAPPEQPPDRDDEPETEKVAVKGYRYTTADGETLYEVIRYQLKLPDGSWKIDPATGTPEKTFRQRRPDGRGGHVWNLDGVEHTIFRHDQVEIAIAEGKTIYLPEGEKDVETLEQWGLVASTNSGGAKNWTDKLAAYFKAADVVIPIDNDDAGRARGEKVARSLKGIAKRVRILDFAPHWATIKPKFDVTDWKDAGGTKDELLKIVDGLRDWMPAPPTSRFGAQQFQNVGKNGIAYDWLIKGLIERNGVFVVAGEMQTGKSFLTIDLGMKVATGEDFGNRKVKQGLVIYVAAEDAKGVELRVEGYRREHGLDAKLVPFLVMTRKVSLLDDKDVDEFIDECLRWAEFYGQKLELIFIDTFSVATEGLDEISGAETGKVLGRVNRIAEKTGAAVGLVMHLNARGERVRGHSSLTANVSQVIELRLHAQFQPNRNLPPKYILDDDGRQIRQASLMKNKNGSHTKWQFVLRQIKLGDDPDGYPITTCVCASVAGGKKEPSPASPLPADHKLVLDALEAAVQDRGIDTPAGTRVGNSIRKVVSQKDFVDQVRKVWPFKAEDDEARNKELSDALRRIVTNLINKDYAGRDNDRKIIWSLHKSEKTKREPKVEDARPPVTEGMKEAIESGVPF
jgi:KaiC/GvpD/RAD55 family RecA-like ATPase